MALLVFAVLAVPLGFLLQAERRRRERRLRAIVAEEIARRTGGVSFGVDPTTGEIVAAEVVDGHTYIARFGGDGRGQEQG